jgi:hypothetical protein
LIYIVERGGNSLNSYSEYVLISQARSRIGFQNEYPIDAMLMANEDDNAPKPELQQEQKEEAVDWEGGIIYDEDSQVG